jgi:hypothetical protein
MRGKGGSGDQIASKDGKYLLVDQYIRHAPFRPSMFGALKWSSPSERWGTTAASTVRREIGNDQSRSVY